MAWASLLLLEWAEEFRDPTMWYVMQFENAENLPDPDDPSLWKFERESETRGRYHYTIIAD